MNAGRGGVVDAPYGSGAVATARPARGSRGPLVLAACAAALSVAATAVAVVLGVLNRSPFQPEALVLLAAIFTTAAVGGLLGARRPGNAVGWILLLMSLLGAVTAFTQEYALRALVVAPGSLSGGTFAAWLRNWVSELMLLPLPLAFLLFPDGRLPSRRWRPVFWIAVLSSLLLALVYVLVPGLITVYQTTGERSLGVANPTGVASLRGVLTIAEGVGLFLAYLGISASVISLVLRWRRAGARERLQLGWLAYAGACGGGATALWVLAAALLGQKSPVAVALGAAGFALLMVGMPVAIGVAILRYRLYEIERIISRTLAYALLTGVLAAVYLALVILLQQVFRPLVGGGDLAIAGSTLAVAAVFRPARRRIQSFVDRRFYRRKYDAARTLEAFSARLREEIDLDSLSYELVAVVRETMQPAHVSLWLRAPVRAGR